MGCGAAKQSKQKYEPQADENPKEQLNPLTNRPTAAANPLRKVFKPVPIDGTWDQEKWLEEFIAVNTEDPTLKDWAKAWPDISDFDPEEAMRKRPDWFKDADKDAIKTISSAVKTMHRWNFERCMITMGEFWMTCTLVMQMQLSRLLFKYTDISKPGLRILDAGCGTGSLCALLAILTHESSEVIGIEIHEGAIYEGQKIIHEPDTFPGLSAERREEVKKKINIEFGDLIRMTHGESSEEMDPFPSDNFDIICMGVAMEQKQLARAIECSRDGAIVLSPVLTSAGSGGDSEGRHSSLFGVYKKKDGGLDGPHETFPVNFIVAGRLSIVATE